MKKTNRLIFTSIAIVLGLVAIGGFYSFSQNKEMKISKAENQNNGSNESIKESQDDYAEKNKNENKENIEQPNNNSEQEENIINENNQNENNQNENNIENNSTPNENGNVEENIVRDEGMNQPENNEPIPPATPNMTPEAIPDPNKLEDSINENNDMYISEIEQAIFTKVNAERTANGLQPLSYNNTMQTYARIKSKDMGDRGYFAHEDPEGKLITEQMKRDGVTYNVWGENIAYIQGNQSNASLANQFMTNWMNSPGHRANILSSNFTSIGVGVYKIGNTYYATQEFYR